MVAHFKGHFKIWSFAVLGGQKIRHKVAFRLLFSVFKLLHMFKKELRGRNNRNPFFNICCPFAGRIKGIFATYHGISTHRK